MKKIVSFLLVFILTFNFLNISKNTKTVKAAETRIQSDTVYKKTSDIPKVINKDGKTYKLVEILSSNTTNTWAMGGRT